MKVYTTISKFKNNKKLISNFLSLSALQVINVLLPFITIPYLTLVVGLENLGKLNFAYALAVFSQIIIEYGFNTTTTREISLLENNKKEQNVIINNVIHTKLILLVFCMLLQIVFFVFIEQYSNNYRVFLLQFGVIVFQAMFPVWYFLGIQKMKFITILNGIFKIIFTAAIFIWVIEKDDYWKAPLFTCIGYALSTLSAYLIIFIKFKVPIKKISLRGIGSQLKNGFYIFLSDLQTGSIANLNILILGFLKGDLAVGIFSIADKIIRAFSNLQLPVINTMFPYLSGLNNNVKSENVIYKTLKWGVLLLIPVLTSMYFLADYIFLIIFGEVIPESVIVFKILLLFPLFSFCNQVVGKLNFIAKGNMFLYFQIVAASTIINLIMCYILTYKFGFIGTAFNVIFIELVVTLGMFYALKKTNNADA